MRINHNITICYRSSGACCIITILVLGTLMYIHIVCKEQLDGFFFFLTVYHTFNPVETTNMSILAKHFVNLRLGHIERNTDGPPLTALNINRISRLHLRFFIYIHVFINQYELASTHVSNLFKFIQVLFTCIISSIL